jgi:hypothetical protein
MKVAPWCPNTTSFHEVRRSTGTVVWVCNECSWSTGILPVHERHSRDDTELWDDDDIRWDHQSSFDDAQDIETLKTNLIEMSSKLKETQ